MKGSMKRRTMWNILYHRISENWAWTTWTVNLLSPRRRRFIKLNLMGEQPGGPDESEWTVCLMRGFWRSHNSAEATSSCSRGDKTAFCCFLWNWADEVGAATDWDAAAWHCWQDSTPDLNCGRTHITDLTPGLPSFPCDLRFNPQRSSPSDHCYTTGVYADIRYHITGECSLMFPSIDQDLPVKTMGYQII